MYIFKNIYFIFNTYQLLPKLQYINIKICMYKQVIPVNCFSYFIILKQGFYKLF